MTALEIPLFIIAYSILIVTIFLEIICYRRKIESIETIIFTVSLLFLVISLTLSPLLPEDQFHTQHTTDIFTLLSMILVGLTTSLNVMEERQHQLGRTWKNGLIFGASALFAVTLTGQFTFGLHVMQYVVALFLGITVLFSMLLLLNNKPRKRIAHLERQDRLFSIVFMIIVPFSLIVNYVFENVLNNNLKFGFTLPVIFILLAGNKLLDDLQRLSLVNSKTVLPVDQHFKNFLLTEREKEIALLLIEGKTYKQISLELFISMPTVKTHAGNIYKKCDVNSRHELTVLMTR